jgi:signal transduction histidine kinase
MRTPSPRAMSTLLVTTAVGVDLLAWNGDVMTAAGPALPSWAPVLATIAVHQSLWWRRSRAAHVFAAQAAFALVSLGVPLWQPVAGLLVASYAAGARGLRVTPVALALAAVAFGHGWGVARSASAPLSALLSVALLTGLLAGIGYAAGHRQWRAGRHVVAAHAAYQRAVEDTRRAALQDERLRIARELHDGVAGSVTTLLLQAAGARAVATDVAPTTSVTLAAIEDQAGRTLDELRRVVDGLRPGAGTR